MIDPQREPWEGVVEVEQGGNSVPGRHSFLDPVKSGKIYAALSR